MIQVLAASIVTLLGFGLLLSSSFAITRTRFGLLVAAIIGTEVVVLGILFIVLAIPITFDRKWLGLSVYELFYDALGFGVVAVVAGICFILITRLRKGGHQLMQAASYGIILPVAVGVLVLWAEGIQAPERSLIQERARIQAEVERQRDYHINDLLTARDIPSSFFGGTIAGDTVDAIKTKYLSIVKQADEAPKRLKETALSVPEGFAITQFIPPLTFDAPTSFALGDNGDVYVGSRQGISRITEVDTVTGEKRVETFIAWDYSTYGLAYRDGALYAAVHTFDADGQVLRLQDTDGDGNADSNERLIGGLTVQVTGGHANNGIAFGPDGRLYMTLGGTSDHGPEIDLIAGSILVMNPDGTGLEVYAKGFRNPYDLAFCNDGQLYATDNGPDHPDGTLLTYYPPDEINRVLQNRHYGYPSFFGTPPTWSDSEAPLAYLVNAGTAGITCYSGEKGLPAFKNNLFVAVSGNLDFPEPPGREVLRIELKENGGIVVGEVYGFASNFGIPVDVFEYIDGSLLILDYQLGQIFQIRYTG